ncbi:MULTISPECIES: divalent cation tolerance protein CutA [Candidatus Ichthyocystis]|uniref:divalent cation tolerance protein CutA n=1 Tax=Candidatus Ichthyocystis TaxID=2929841 RepID=UPI000B81001D|nr:MULTISPECIES: divalent cation tolerance protein CutA [Ichthyocystis]
MDKIVLRNLVKKAFVGLYDYERYQKQTICIHATLHLQIAEHTKFSSKPELDYSDVVFGINKILDEERFLLVEGLSHRILGYLFEYSPIDAVHLQVFKDRPIENIDSVGIELFRTRQEFMSKKCDQNRVVVVKSHAPDPSIATDIIQILIEKKLIACGTLLHESLTTYCWENQTHTQRVFPFELKTVASALQSVSLVIKQKHPDIVPEIIVLPVSNGLESYLEWVQKSVEAF